MKVYSNANWDWDKFGMEAPDYRNGDIFYAIYDNKIIAVKVTHSYLKISDCNTFKVCATFETPTKNTIFDTKGKIIISNRNKEKCLKLSLSTNNYPIYETIEDAKNNIKNKYSIIHVSSFNVVNKGYEYAKICFGPEYHFELYYWGYYPSTLNTKRFVKKVTDLVWTDNNELLFSKEEIPIADEKWATEVEVLNYIEEQTKAMEVVSFEEEEKRPKKEVKTFELSLKITTDMTAEEITKLISEQMAKEKESAN